MNNGVSKVYLLTDPHWGHTAMQKYCNRPADFGQKIINQWQATVSPPRHSLRLRRRYMGFSRATTTNNEWSTWNKNSYKRGSR